MSLNTESPQVSRPFFSSRDRPELRVASGHPSRIGALDGIRSVAILLVFSFHFTGWYEHTGYFLDTGSLIFKLISLLRSGHIGVDLFFVMSGYLIHLTLSKRPPDIYFFVRRFYRLFPAHIIVCLYIAWVTNTMDLQTFLLNALFLAPLLNGAHIYNDVTWTLAWEWVFYAAIFVSAIVSNKSALRVFAISFFVALVFTQIPYFLPGFNTISMGRFFGFLIGILLAHLLSLRPNGLSVGKSNAVAGLAFAAILLFMIFWKINPELIENLPLQGGMYIGVSLCFMLIIRESFVQGGVVHRVFSLAPFQLVGKISYSFYLVHSVVIGTMLNEMSAVNSFGGVFLRYLVVLGTTLVIASIMYFLFEKPYFKARAKKFA